MPQEWSVITGIQGGSEQANSWFTPFAVSDGTDDLHVRYRRKSRGVITNRIRLNNELVDPKDYEKEIVKGFNEMYEWIVSNEIKLIETATDLLTRDDIIIRHVIRSTSFYSLLVRRSLLPELRSGDLVSLTKEGYSILKETDLITDTDIYKFQLYHEIRDILNLDIPYFIESPLIEISTQVMVLSFPDFFPKDVHEDLKIRLLKFKSSRNEFVESIQVCLKSTRGEKNEETPDSSIA